MRAIFAHGAFDTQAAALSGIALAAYGVGLPAMALVRIFASTFYARHDTATPARVTLRRDRRRTSRIKFVLVWGFHLGIAGIALGTSFGAWVNVVLLVWLGSRGVRCWPSMTLSGAPSRRSFWRRLLSGSAPISARTRWATSTSQVCGTTSRRCTLAGVFAGVAYVGVVLACRRSLPLGRFGT